MNRVGLIFTAVLLLAGSIGSVSGEEKQQRFYLNPHLGAEQFERRNDFRFGALYDQFSTTRLEDFQRDTDNTAISGGFSAGVWLTDRVGLELSFGTSHGDASRKLSITTTPTFGSMTVFPAIGAPVQIGAGFSQAVVLRLPSAVFCPTCLPVRWRLDYDQNIFDIHLDARVRPWQSKDKGSWLEGVLGFAYLRVNQEFHHLANGSSEFGVGTRIDTTIDTNVDLTDNLFGGRVGTRGQYQIWSKLTLTGEAFGEFYRRKSNLTANQDISSPMILVGAGGGFGIMGNTIEYSGGVRTSDSGFVPRVSGKFRLAYDFADWGSLGVTYRFNALWNMSRPDAPTVILNVPPPVVGIATAILDHPLRIKADDRMFSHFYGLELAIKF